MSLEQVMRRRWADRSDRELLYALFLEDLSAEGRRVLGLLAAERVGAVEDLAQRHAQVQGQRQGAIRVRACRLGDDPALPAMRGELVLCTGGLGFVPGGLDEDHQLATGLGQVFGGVLGAVIQDLGRAAQPVPNLRRARLPVPLLAAISDHARFWVPDPTYRLHWRPDGGELWQGSTSLLRADAVLDASQAIAAWAATQAFAAAAADDGPPSDDGSEPVG